MVIVVLYKPFFFLFVIKYFVGARCSVVVKSLCCKPEGFINSINREVVGSSPDEVDFLN
jgi:hypothetical protein